MNKTNKKFCVYEHIFPNCKRYIGITSKKPMVRWENGKGYTKEHQSAMYYAIQKYGWDNIQHNILFTDLTKQEAQHKEPRRHRACYQLRARIHRYGKDPS